MSRVQLTKLLVIFSLTATVLLGIAAADLKSDLREFAALIPRRRIGYIAARHYILDQRFRHALDYIRSPKFQETWRSIRETPEFVDLVEYLTQNTTSGNVDVATHFIESVPSRFRSFQLPSKVPVDMLVEQRNLGYFLKDSVRSLPRNRIASLMAKKAKEGGDFAELYKAARSERFRQLIDEGKSSENLAEPLLELEMNSINVNEVIEIGFKVLKWGP